MKAALIKYKENIAGILKETDEGYEFLYDTEYLSDADSKPISLIISIHLGLVSRQNCYDHHRIKRLSVAVLFLLLAYGSQPTSKL